MTQTSCVTLTTCEKSEKEGSSEPVTIPSRSRKEGKGLIGPCNTKMTDNRLWTFINKEHKTTQNITKPPIKSDGMTEYLSLSMEKTEN